MNTYYNMCGDPVLDFPSLIDDVLSSQVFMVIWATVGFNTNRRLLCLNLVGFCCVDYLDKCYFYVMCFRFFLLFITVDIYLRASYAASRYCFWRRLSVCLCICASVRTKSRKLLVRNWCNLVAICPTVNARSIWKLVTFDVNLWPRKLLGYIVEVTRSFWHFDLDIGTLRS